MALWPSASASSIHGRHKKMGTTVHQSVVRYSDLGSKQVNLGWKAGKLETIAGRLRRSTGTGQNTKQAKDFRRRSNIFAERTIKK